MNSPSKFDMLGLTAISGVNFKKASELYVHLGVRNIEELYNACKKGEVQRLKGWGASTEQRIKSEIELNLIWLHGQCTKLKNNRILDTDRRPDREFLLSLVKEQAKENLK